MPSIFKPPTLSQGFAPYINAGTNANAARAARVGKAIDRKVNTAMKSIAGAIRRKARKSIKAGGAKRRKHGTPGGAIISPKPGRIMFNTVERHYDVRKMSLVVGFKKTGFAKLRKDGARGIGVVSVPQLLEYGGSIHARKPTVLLAAKTQPKWVTSYWKTKKDEVRAKRRRLGKTAKQMPLPKKKDIKWVVIPPGNRKVDARPTMRLAFNEVIKASNLRKHWQNIRIDDPSELEKPIF